MSSVAVIGSGPNGLAAAAVAAREGLEVTVYEANDSIGGAARTVPLEGSAARFDLGSAVHPMALQSEFFRLFRMEDRIELRLPEVQYGHPLDRGRAGLAYRDLERTAEELGVDGRAFRNLMAPLSGNADQALKLWRQAVDAGVDPVPMVAALGAKLRLIALVAGSRGGSGQVAREVGAAPWQVERAQNEARRFTAADVTAALRAVAHADAQVKGESRTPYYAVERAITVIATAGRH